MVNKKITSSIAALLSLFYVNKASSHVKPIVVTSAVTGLIGITTISHKVINRKSSSGKKNAKKQKTEANQDRVIADSLSKNFEVSSCDDQYKGFYKISCEKLEFYICFLNVDGFIRVLGCQNYNGISIIQSILNKTKHQFEKSDWNLVSNCTSFIGGFIVNCNYQNEFFVRSKRFEIGEKMNLDIVKKLKKLNAYCMKLKYSEWSDVESNLKLKLNQEYGDSRKDRGSILIF